MNMFSCVSESLWQYIIFCLIHNNTNMYYLIIRRFRHE